MNRCTQPLPPLLAAVSLALSAPVWAFSFEDIEKLEAAEQQELLELARRAAAARNFTQARSYIDQARHKGYNPQAIQAAEDVYKREYAAFEEQKRREEAERQARLAREEAERQAAQRAGRAGGVTDFWMGSGSPVAYKARCSNGFSPSITAGSNTSLGQSWCTSNAAGVSKCEYTWSARDAAEWACLR